MVALLVTCAGGGVASAASANEWPLERQFPLVEPPPPLHFHPPPSDVVADGRGGLFVLVYWPSVQRTKGTETEFGHTRLLRIAPDGSRRVVSPFDAQVDDEILPLKDGSILFTRYNAIDRLRAN